MTETQKLREALQAIANIDDATNHSVDASAALDRIGQIARQALALPTADHLPDVGEMVETAAPVGDREAFERTMMDKFGWQRNDFKLDDFGYFDGHTDTAWMAWQARASLSAGDAVDAQRYRWLADCNNYEAGLALIIDPKLTEQALGAAIDAAILVRGEGDPLTRYRVWPDGTVQEGAESPYAWMSDDFEYVDATDEEQAALSAAMRKEKP